MHKLLQLQKLYILTSSNSVARSKIMKYIFVKHTEFSFIFMIRINWYWDCPPSFQFHICLLFLPGIYFSENHGTLNSIISSFINKYISFASFVDP